MSRNDSRQPGILETSQHRVRLTRVRRAKMSSMRAYDHKILLRGFMDHQRLANIQALSFGGFILFLSASFSHFSLSSARYPTHDPSSNSICSYLISPLSPIFSTACLEQTCDSISAQFFDPSKILLILPSLGQDITHNLCQSFSSLL